MWVVLSSLLLGVSAQLSFTQNTNNVLAKGPNAGLTYEQFGQVSKLETHSRDVSNFYNFFISLCAMVHGPSHIPTGPRRKPQRTRAGRLFS